MLSCLTSRRMMTFLLLEEKERLLRLNLRIRRVAARRRLPRLLPLPLLLLLLRHQLLPRRRLLLPRPLLLPRHPRLRWHRGQFVSSPRVRFYTRCLNLD